MKSSKSKGIEEEVRKEFPNLINHLTNVYPDLKTIKEGKKETQWYFFSKDFGILGLIETYHTQCGKDRTEYGYRGNLFIDKRWVRLEYRKGYISPDGSKDVVITHEPLRYDKEKNIPFP